MTVNEALMDYLVAQGVGVEGTTIFHSEAQAKADSKNAVYWIVRRSQSPIRTNMGRQYRQVFMDVYYIHKQQQAVHESMELIDSIFSNCPDLPPYTCTDFEVVNHFVDSQTVDERYYGVVSVRITLRI